jgi:purine nucleosidase
MYRFYCSLFAFIFPCFLAAQFSSDPFFALVERPGGKVFEKSSDRCLRSIDAGQQKVWLDADTGNEMNDLYAIVRLVQEPSIDLIGLSSAHFNNADLLVFEEWNGHKTKGINTVAESQRLNEQILKALNRLDIPHPVGADRQIGRAWGQEDPRDSPAAQAIVAAAKALPEGQKLDVLTTGAMTNVAAALMLAPGILPKIRVYALGSRYNPQTKAWGKNEFNIRNDLNAFDYLLNLKDLDLIVMPLETACPLKFQREDAYERLSDHTALETMLEARWRAHFKDQKSWAMCDLALVEAYLKPGFARLKSVKTPAENTPHKIRVYAKIDEKAMAEDFWKVLKTNAARLPL